MSVRPSSIPSRLSARFFSAVRFYAYATGSALGHSKALVTLDCEIPERGTLIIPPDPRGDSELVWIHGVAALSEQRERFLETIRAGEIPTPLPGSDLNGECPRVRHHPLEVLHAREQTVASLLGMTQHLVDAASRSRWARCPGCAQPLPIFHTATELRDHLLSTLREQNCRIDLIGPSEEISPWATEKGFSVASHTPQLSSLRIDSLTFSAEALQTLEPIIASTKRLSRSWLTITGENVTDEYGWNGRCAQCDITLSPFNRSAARDLIERSTSSPATQEGNRLVDEVPLSALLSMPLVRSLNGSLCKERLSPLQREAIQTLSLEKLTLNAFTSDLAPETLGLVVLLDLARNRRDSRELSLFTAPASLFSKEVLPSVQALIEKLSRSGPFVWLTVVPNEHNVSTLATRSTKTAQRLGTITLNAQPTQLIELTRGGWSEIVPPSSLHHLRIAALTHESIAGKTNDLVSSEVPSPVSSFLVPLFPCESSGTRLVAHALGVIEPLAKMFAASHQAKMLGLTPRELLLGQLRQVATVCATCKGTGVLMTKGTARSATEPCHTCWGSRFRSPAREITFKGRTLWEILNAPLSDSQDTLRALPKMKEVFELASTLGIADLPLGMPVTLLSIPQRRVLAIAHAMLSGTRSRPSVIVIEEPIVGLSGQQRAGLEAAVTDPTFEERVSWIGVSGREADNGPE